MEEESGQITEAEQRLRSMQKEQESLLEELAQLKSYKSNRKAFSPLPEEF